MSTYLQTRHDEAALDPARYGDVLDALRLQYFTDAREQDRLPDERRRHYEAGVGIVFNGRTVRGVERIYTRTLLVLPTLVCAAHCRWCVRGQYPIETMSADDIELAMNLFVVGDEVPPGIERFIGASAAELAAADSLTVLRGSGHDMVDELQRRRDAFGVSYLSVNAAFLDQLAPVVARLAGQ